MNFVPLDPPVYAVTAELYGIDFIDSMTINISWRVTENDEINKINLEYICYVNSTEATVCMII